jgi:hypothetical protein
MVPFARDAIGENITDVPSLVVRDGQSAPGVVVGTGARIVAAANYPGAW